jgi:hypothetical protein
VVEQKRDAAPTTASSPPMAWLWLRRLQCLDIGSDGSAVEPEPQEIIVVELQLLAAPPSPGPTAPAPTCFRAARSRIIGVEPHIVTAPALQH